MIDVICQSFLFEALWGKDKKKTEKKGKTKNM
jgi:hypothetical protein